MAASKRLGGARPPAKRNPRGGERPGRLGAQNAPADPGAPPAAAPHPATARLPFRPARSSARTEPRVMRNAPDAMDAKAQAPVQLPARRARTDPHGRASGPNHVTGQDPRGRSMPPRFLGRSRPRPNPCPCKRSRCRPTRTACGSTVSSRCTRRACPSPCSNASSARAKCGWMAAASSRMPGWRPARSCGCRRFASMPCRNRVSTAPTPRWWPN